jgi:hypothetical protein
VATETGIVQGADYQVFESSLFADYATAGIENESLSLAIAGVAGALIVVAVGTGILAAIRLRHDSSTTV